jgi:cytochrome c
MPLSRQKSNAAFAVVTLFLAAPASAQSTLQDTSVLGARAFIQCRSCHTLKPQQGDQIGPNLAGFFGRQITTNRPEFKYSEAAKGSKLVWNEANLDLWLENPSGLIPGTTMAFVGIAKPETRAALIAYLKKETR